MGPQPQGIIKSSYLAKAASSSPEATMLGVRASAHKVGGDTVQSTAGDQAEAGVVDSFVL